jgi:hypothetical protein
MVKTLDDHRKVEGMRDTLANGVVVARDFSIYANTTHGGHATVRWTDF